MKPIAENNFFSPNRKLQMVKWWIPPLIHKLKTEHQAMVLHYKKLNFFVQSSHQVFQKSATCFPLKITIFKNTSSYFKKYKLGFLVIMQALSKKSTQWTQAIIDDYLQQMVRTIHHQDKKSLPIKKARLLKESIFLIQKKSKKEIFKTAFDLYLKSNCLAFFLSSELRWKKEMFQKLTDGFILIPSFKELSPSQKIIFKQLTKPHTCKVALGKLPLEKIPSSIAKQFLFKKPLNSSLASQPHLPSISSVAPVFSKL